MKKNKKISFVLPVFNEQENIKNFILEIQNIGIECEIIAVNNNSTDLTEREIKKTSAVYIEEKIQGYGAAIKKGISRCTNELIVLCEPDGTFQANDVFKLLSYIDDFDAVFGTRTSKSMIMKEAKMYPFLRLGNIAVAKFLSIMFNGPSLTDVGCTFKMFKKNAYSKIEKFMKVNDSTFQPELMIEFIRNKKKIVEVPVFYKVRIGYSKITYNFTSSFLLGMKMITLIIKKRFDF
ncbi:glycosyltransferase family 2 protein [Pelagibacteraceae bacterium]|nr:glycosyltransferase family 2 protein [Pelagibacteraceae bacterium]